MAFNTRRLIRAAVLAGAVAPAALIVSSTFAQENTPVPNDQGELCVPLHGKGSEDFVPWDRGKPRDDGSIAEP